jgi:hypothetical protein
LLLRYVRKNAILSSAIICVFRKRLLRIRG